MTITRSPTGTHHVLDDLGVATLCGLDLSTPARLLWPVWDGQSWLSLPYRCEKCNQKVGA